MLFAALRGEASLLGDLGMYFSLTRLTSPAQGP